MVSILGFCEDMSGFPSLEPQRFRSAVSSLRSCHRSHRRAQRIERRLSGQAMAILSRRGECSLTTLQTRTSGGWAMWSYPLCRRAADHRCHMHGAINGAHLLSAGP